MLRGLSPSGPPTEFFGKEQIACATSSLEMEKCHEVSLADGMVESECGAGCFPLRASRVASFIGASVSPELASLTAPLR